MDPSDEPSDLIPGRMTAAERQRRRDAELAAGPPACCSCGKPTTLDPLLVGMTCGGLWLRGWYVCPDHHGTHARALAEVCEAPTWSVSKGGRSVELGTGRLRFGAIKIETGERLDVVGLMARVARLPELERRLVAIEHAVKSWEHGNDADVAMKLVAAACATESNSVVRSAPPISEVKD